jgi:surfeit locus 1 family protein
MTDPAARRFPIGLTIAVAIALAILLTLGTWQVERLHWKQALLARIAATQAAPPRPLAEALARAGRGEDVDFARVTVDCLEAPLEPSRVLLYGIKEGEPVWRPIAPCRIAAGRWTLIAIDRGVARGEGPNPPQPVLPNPDHVEGVLRRPERLSAVQRFAGTGPQNAAAGYRDRAAAVAAVAAAAGGRMPDYMIVAARETPAPPFVTPAPLPLNITNRHLEYAVTWYGLAAALLGVYGSMVWQRMKRPKATP